MFAGVLSGIAKQFNWNKTILRIIWVILTLTPFPGLILYLLLWIIIPKEDLK
ncbi:PspC domain-containing protein [Apilactobacillus micheneri]|uniref:PspC domain-containing protein n=1 Tax=Apilactobacillus micheneri TaxID=1899430 RepID=A0ABY2YZ83_9LACO|nr:PspC domain-containing protein [Apilactobacillus micheneri]TPR26518.1 PspC domain-containing protein [Apilactobacillus micheneri]TPR27272.1 PspC domain-containing protein [Apilactobacillus micheneri]TPR27508.1 PspC domain-containing protein [Apilactobacillus micheneri]TPR32035.1 PspC domain-containing protein [Apilactobacillus micheneri]TPR32439.1 PspC domain-containing protein [Apilactobacillus micheneri]